MLKKIIIVFFLFSFCLFCLSVFHKAKKEFIRKETFIRQLNIQNLKTKSKNKPPRWMEEQIKEDFGVFLSSGISKKRVDETFKALRKNYPNPFFVRYRIINNKLYRYENNIAPNIEPSIEKALKTLLLIFSFKDMDFILSYQDGILLPEHPKDFYHTSSFNEQAPIFCPAKPKGSSYIITFPDWRSLDNWWASEIKEVLKASKKTTWEMKKNFGFWRGSLTNHIRIKLCQISINNPDYLDARINAKLETKELQAKLEKEGIYGDLSKVPWDKILEHKYLPFVDGVMTASPAFQSRLLSNSLTLKQEFDGIEWFYKALKPFVHYVPVKKDLSDLIDMFNWAKAHDNECQKIVLNARKFALNNLMFEDVYLYFYLVLKQYSSLQTLDRKELKKEMKNSSWKKIENRFDFKKALKDKILKIYRKLIY